MSANNDQLGLDARGTSNRAIDLSVILPSYRTALLAERSAETLIDFLDARGISFEIIVVDDGGKDFGMASSTQNRRVRVVRLPLNRGKGAAVRAGMRSASGRVRIFTDVDLPYELDLLPVIMDYVDDGFHVVIGDRTLRGSSYRQDVGWRRRVASRLFSTFVGKLVTGGFFDTQCGLKGFRGDVAEHLFAIGRLNRFAFDVELIYLALVHRLDIKRIPVRLRRSTISSVRLLRDSPQMLLDVLRIKGHQMRGDYRCRALEEIVMADFDRRRAQVARATAPTEVREVPI